MTIVNLNLHDKEILIVGGGHVALRKAILYSEEGANVHIISKEIKEELKNYKYTLKEIEDDDLEDYFFVYAATNNKDLNHHIVEVCNEKGILTGSANDDSDVTLKSVSYYKHALGTLAFSSNTAFPYMYPVLHEMSHVLDAYKERLEALQTIRKAMTVKYDFKDIVEDLYNASMEVVLFVAATLENKNGYIYIHHNIDDTHAIHVNLSPALILSISELESYMKIFKLLPVTYIPLVVSEGNILNKINSITSKKLRPLIENDADLKQVLDLFKKENIKLCVYLHPRKHLAYSVYSNDEVEFHLLDEHVTFNFNIQYHVISFLMNHGNHYKKITEHITNYNENGFRVYNLGVLSDHKEVIEILENKNKVVNL